MRLEFPTSDHPFEHVAFLHLVLRTLEGPAHVFMAVDGCSSYAMNVATMDNDRKDTVLKVVRSLLADQKFTPDPEIGFTLVMGDHTELIYDIEKIIQPYKGKISFDPEFHLFLCKDLLDSIAKSMGKNV